MTNETLSRVSARSASEVCQRFDIGSEAKALLRPELSPRQFIDLLVEKKNLPAAIRFLAHALPKPDAVWWACLCVRETIGAKPTSEASVALQAAEKWVTGPSELTRRAAMPAAQAAGLSTPAGSAALAAFMSGGSLGPAHVPPVPPADHMTGEIVGSAVLLASIAREPEKSLERFKAFLDRGLDVANGGQRWTR